MNKADQRMNYVKTEVQYGASTSGENKPSVENPKLEAVFTESVKHTWRHRSKELKAIFVDQVRTHFRYVSTQKDTYSLEELRIFWNEIYDFCQMCQEEQFRFYEEPSCMSFVERLDVKGVDITTDKIGAFKKAYSRKVELHLNWLQFVNGGDSTEADKPEVKLVALLSIYKQLYEKYLKICPSALVEAASSEEGLERILNYKPKTAAEKLDHCFNDNLIRGFVSVLTILILAVVIIYLRKQGD